MSELKVRGLSEETIVKLTREAKKWGISREEFVRKILENFSVAPALLQQEEKYNSLLLMIAEVLTLNTQTIQEFGNTLQKSLWKGGYDL